MDTGVVGRLPGPMLEMKKHRTVQKEGQRKKKMEMPRPRHKLGIKELTPFIRRHSRSSSVIATGYNTSPSPYVASPRPKNAASLWSQFLLTVGSTALAHHSTGAGAVAVAAVPVSLQGNQGLKPFGCTLHNRSSLGRTITNVSVSFSHD